MLIARSRFPVGKMLLLGAWPSPVKTLFYRLIGHRIGKGVRLGFGSIICGEHVEVGDYTRIGPGTVVRGKEIRIGRHVEIGAATFIDTPHVDIGEGTKINEQVFVGGLQFPDSRFTVGRNCLIQQLSFINPSRSITIGDDSGVGVNCQLIGHASWLSKLEGYPVEFSPITIGTSVALAWRVTVLPGTKIGDGAVIGADSLVKGTIPGRCLATGVPARVVSKAPYFPRALKDAEKVRYLRAIVDEMAEYFRGYGLSCREDGPLLEVKQTRRRWLVRREKSWRLLTSVNPLAAGDTPASDVFLSLREIHGNVRAGITGRGKMWIDLEKKERSEIGNDLGEEVVQYLKRYGIRLLRS